MVSPDLPHTNGHSDLYADERTSPIESPVSHEDELLLAEIAHQLGAIGVRSGIGPDGNSNIEGAHRVGIIDFGNNQTREALIGGLGEMHVSLPGDSHNLARSIETARSLILQMLQSKAPGTVKLSVFNRSMSTDFADFNELGPLYEHIQPNGLQSFINGLEDRHSSLAARGQTTGDGLEPWQIAVIVGDSTMPANQRAQIDRLIAAGADYGSIITVGVDTQPNTNLHSEWYVDRLKPDAVQYDAGPDSIEIRRVCKQIAREASKGIESPPLSKVVNGEIWQESARSGLSIPIGFDVATKEPFVLPLDNQRTVHMLLTGKTGSGKSNVLNTIIASVSHHYAPEEASLYLLDYKEGVEFARYGKAESYLPNAKVVGEKSETDPEFGVAVLDHMLDEIRRRGARLQELGASTYAELHDDPENNWPQIILVIDEFQKLLKGELAADAVDKMMIIGQQGRAMGIHMILASQDVSDIDALLAKNRALFTNFGLRLTTSHGTMLNVHNTAAETVMPHHVVVNTNSGNPDSNTIVWLPDASSPEHGRKSVAKIQKAILERYLERHKAEGDTKAPARPYVYNSSVVPSLEAAHQFKRLKLADLDPRLLVAGEIAVNDRSAGFRLSRDHGMNLAVIGNASRRREVNQAMYAAALSLGKQKTADNARFSFVCLDTQSASDINQTVSQLKQFGHADIEVIRPAQAPKFFNRVSNDLDPEAAPSHFVFVYGADASASVMERPSVIERAYDFEGGRVSVSDGEQVTSSFATLGTTSSGASIKAPGSGKARVSGSQVTFEMDGASGRQSLQKLLESGPEAGVHVIGSYSSVTQMESVLNGKNGVFSGKREVIGAYVAIGVQPNELTRYTPDAPLFGRPIQGIERPGRAIYYDRTAKPPRTVRLYGLPLSDDEEDEDDF